MRDHVDTDTPLDLAAPPLGASDLHNRASGTGTASGGVVDLLNAFHLISLSQLPTWSASASEYYLAEKGMKS